MSLTWRASLPLITLSSTASRTYSSIMSTTTEKAFYASLLVSGKLPKCLPCPLIRLSSFLAWSLGISTAVNQLLYSIRWFIRTPIETQDNLCIFILIWHYLLLTHCTPVATYNKVLMVESICTGPPYLYCGESTWSSSFSLNYFV